MTDRPHISIVTPVYNAEECLRELYRRLKASLEPITQDFEIIMVEDCGGDRSWDIIVELAKEDSRVKGIQFSRNFGQHYAITAGLDYAKGDWVVVMDCDLQDRPEEIPRLYEKAQEGYDMVQAKRGKRKDSFLKSLTSKTFYSIFNYFTDLKYDGSVGNFRIMSHKVNENFCSMRESLRFFGALINWVGFSSTTLDVHHASRFAGKTTYTIKKLFNLGLDTIITYSDKPLKISIKIGFIMSFLSCLYGGYIIFKKIFWGIPVMGWASLMSSLFLIGGIIIFNLGVIGLYLGKTFSEVKKRPLYIISHILGLEEKKS